MKVRKEIKEKTCKLLLQHPAFSCAEPEKIAAMLNSDDTLLHDAEKGQQLFPSRSAKKAAVLILSGQAAIKRDGKICSTADEGTIIGTTSLYASENEDICVTALSPCRAVILRKAAVDELLSKDFEAAQGYMAYLSHKINEVGKAATEKTAALAQAKLAAYLLSEEKNSPAQYRLTQDLLKLAKQLSLSKEALFKAIDKLNACGAIKADGGAILIADSKKLEDFI